MKIMFVVFLQDLQLMTCPQLDRHVRPSRAVSCLQFLLDDIFDIKMLAHIKVSEIAL